MATIEQRLKALEQQQSDAPMLVLFVGDRPTPEQQAEIDKATKQGRMMIVFVAEGDRAWIAGCGKPAPWDEQQGARHGND
ncbi:MAG: hypothetical protein Q8O64_12875 [Sideroxyarcus sp.]|nr:hypothetical protein [Sideroxyarcus sp.]